MKLAVALLVFASIVVAQAPESAPVAKTPEVSPPVYKTCEWSDAPHYKNTYTAGGSAGFVNGVGLLYRQWFENHGFQVVLLPFVNIQGKNQSIFLDIGGTYLHPLWESRMEDFVYLPTRSLAYYYVGLQYLLDKTKEVPSGVSTGTDQEYHLMTAGGGFGWQLNINAIQLSLGIGYAVVVNRYDDDFWSPSGTVPGPFRTTYRIQPTIDGTLGYTFGW
jgi:hypothetical protein